MTDLVEGFIQDSHIKNLRLFCITINFTIYIVCKEQTKLFFFFFFFFCFVFLRANYCRKINCTVVA